MIGKTLFLLESVLVLLLMGLNVYEQYEPVVIGTSNLSTATAFNNARHIVRDSSDMVYVFYHDLVKDRPVIWTTHA